MVPTVTGHLGSLLLGVRRSGFCPGADRRPMCSTLCATLFCVLPNLSPDQRKRKAKHDRERPSEIETERERERGRVERGSGGL